MTTIHTPTASCCAALPASSDLFAFGSDITLRARWFRRASEHPAKLHLGLLCRLVER